MSFRRKPESILFDLDASFRWHDIYFWADLLKLRHHQKIVSRQAAGKAIPLGKGAKILFLNHFATLRLCARRTFGII